MSFSFRLCRYARYIYEPATQICQKQHKYIYNDMQKECIQLGNKKKVLKNQIVTMLNLKKCKFALVDKQMIYVTEN